MLYLHYMSAYEHQIFEILVSTPHNTPLIMGDRHKNFEDPMTTSRDIKKTNHHLLGFYLITVYIFFLNTFIVHNRYCTIVLDTVREVTWPGLSEVTRS